jgi:hypothetical protein
MSKKILCAFVLILLVSASADAAYKIYLKNGSVISGVSSYEKKDGEVLIHLGGGSMGIPEKDILKIEESGISEKDFTTRESTDGQKEAPSKPLKGAENDKRSRFSALQAEYDAVISEIRVAEGDETRLVNTINEKTGQRTKYNIYQLKQLEKEIEPLKQELEAARNKKAELVKRKNALEDEMKASR